MIFHTYAGLFVVFIYVLLEFLEGKLISVFKLAIRGTIFLNGVIGQVDKSIINIFQIYSKLRAACS
jgi:hypothetical protein